MRGSLQISATLITLARVLLENAVFRTMDRTTPTLDWLAIAGDTIVDARTAPGRDERLDLDGCCVLPGFTDSHVHFPSWAMVQRWVRLEDCGTIEEAVARVRAAAATAPPDRWLVGYGWGSGNWQRGREPSRADLDPVTDGVPAAMWSQDYHSLWLSSSGLGRARGDLGAGGAGVVATDDRGEPTGLLREEAAWRFRDRHIVFTIDDYAAATSEAIGLAHAQGLTAVHDKDGRIGAPHIWARVRDAGALSLRVWQSVLHGQAGEFPAPAAEGADADPFLRVGYLKVFMDGSLNSGTAHMLDGSGIEVTSGEELEEIIRDASRSGWQLAVHAIGDRANRDALDAFEATRGEWQPRGLRQRIEHAQHVHPDDIPRFGALGIACSVQFSHATTDRDAAEALVPHRLDGTYAFRSLLDSGALLANGSDAPVDVLDPLLGICAGVLRTVDDRPGWRVEQALTVQQALEASTVNPAWLCGEEGRRGRLVPGQLADLVVLDRDPVTCPPEELRALRVVATMVGGRWVFGPWQ
jgi:predicted amidohydrolase YtcJ